jgi:hypothetical protein
MKKFVSDKSVVNGSKIQRSKLKETPSTRRPPSKAMIQRRRRMTRGNEQERAQWLSASERNGLIPAAIYWDPSETGCGAGLGVTQPPLKSGK